MKQGRKRDPVNLELDLPSTFADSLTSGAKSIEAWARRFWIGEIYVLREESR